MSARITIALDCMGGDVGPAVVVPSAVEVLRRHEDVALILVGHQTLIKAQLASLQAEEIDRLRIHHTEEVVRMDDSPIQALRRKKQSSMRLAVDLVAKGEASACVSAGNTGALMAISHFVLKTIPCVDRCAIIAAFPTYRGRLVRLLDLGANVDSTAKHLYQFALMGSVLSSILDHLEKPKVALLNVGVENIKGNACVKEADRLLRASHQINYVGYVEGDQIFSGDVDVIVCDGFVGNILLKSSEGLVKLLMHVMKQSFSNHLWAKVVGCFAKPFLSRASQVLDTRKQNGANLLGLRGIVLKSHGRADQISFVSAIENAKRSAEEKLSERIAHRIDTLASSKED